MLAFLTAFNWTKVELKPKKTDAATDALKTFNWTKVELKPDILAYDIILGGTMLAENLRSRLSAFNWTKVELKRKLSEVAGTENKLLIELR